MMGTIWGSTTLERIHKLPSSLVLVMFLFIWAIYVAYYLAPVAIKRSTHYRFFENLPDLSNQSSASAWKDAQVEILIWTSSTISKSRKLRLSGIKKDMEGQSCFEGCRLTVGRNQSQFNRADAVVFFMFTKGYKSEDLPVRRNWDQIWIYNQHEPPSMFSPGAHLNGIFNWTMTYRQDSDIYQPYLRTFPIKSTEESKIFRAGVPIHEWVKQKTDLATAVISNCRTGSRREAILNKLMSVGIPIYIYGACGNKTNCTNAHSCNQFWERLASRYKFFFSFENSFCSDYITEKFWRPLDLGIVPVVLGKGEYSKLAPPNSYIDLRDFSSPEELKGYLQKLDSDWGEYAKYFEWKRNYSVKYNTDNFCELCKTLRSLREERMSSSILFESSVIKFPTQPRSKFKNHKVYNNLTGWWTTEPGRSCKPACSTPEGMGLSKFLK